MPKGNVRAIFFEFCEIQRKSPCRHAMRVPKGHTCVTKGLFSDVHAAGKKFEFGFFDKQPTGDEMRIDTYQLTLLYDFFGELLTGTQREYFEYYYSDDLSLSEIAELTGVTRQSVRAVLARAEALLREYEAKTGVVARFRELSQKVDELQTRVSELMALSTGRAGELAREIRDGLEELKG